MVRVDKPSAIVLDMEGTITSTKFWSEALVPFIKDQIENCLKERWNEPEVKDVVDRLRRRTHDDNRKGSKIPAIADEEADKDEIIRTVVKNVRTQMDQKRYTPTIKQMQIIVWMYGLQKEELKGHVFPDVSTAFHNWKTRYDIKIYIFSSLISIAQRLLFACSVKGNLSQLIDDYFDLEIIGTKTNSESYNKIADEIGENTSSILFISDNPKELRAAQLTGCKTLLITRPGNPSLSTAEGFDFEMIKNLLEIKFN